MVRITAGILQHASGKIENKVFRIMNGKTFVSNRPAKYNYSSSKGAVSRRAKFAVVIEFSKFINSIPSLKIIWTSAKIKGTTSFNRLIKYNTNQAGEKSPTIKNVITPYENIPSNNILNFPLHELHFSKEAGMIKIVMSKAESGFEYNKDYNLVLVLMPFEPKRKSYNYFRLNHLELTNNITKDLPEINIELDNSIISSLNRYKKIIIYFSAYREVGGRIKFLWSKTFAKEFNLEES